MSQNRKMNAGLKNIILIGFVSFFADISSEMVYPVIPLYLVSAFGATPVLVGIIEGIAESLASLLKVFSGYISDRFNKKKAIAFSGYSTGLIYKIALLTASSWVGILGARIIDRFGKGIRTAPRDVMVAESSTQTQMGKSFGIHKALDMAGSAIGILLAYIILTHIGDAAYKPIFVISIIPIIISLILFIFIKEKKRDITLSTREHFWQNIKSLDKNLKLYLAVAFIFTLGNSSNAFLLLKAADVGFSSTNTILLYFAYNLTASLLAVLFGKKSDKTGRKKILIAGYLTFAIVYLLFAFATQKWALVMAFVLYGAYAAQVTGVERAFIAEITPAHMKGTMLGLHSTIVGVALLPASVIAGALWSSVGSFAPFLFGAVLSFGAAILLLFFFKPSISQI